MRLNVYAAKDHCGPTFSKYVGPKWDAAAFIGRMLCNSKLCNKPRTYLVYKGGNDQTSHFWPDRLIADNDLGREYDPDPKLGEPAYYETGPIFAEVTEWLKENVLRKIKFEPLPEKEIDIFKPEIPVPASSRPGPLFTIAEYRDCMRIIKGQKDKMLLDPSDRYALEIGYRFVHLGVPDNDGTIPEAAYHGSVWCGIGAVDGSTQAIDLEIPGHIQWSSQDYVVRVTLNRANDVYIADMEPYERVRASLFAKREKGYYLTDEEVNLCSQASGRTVIPLASYNGGYKLPVVLVNRQLELDEVKVVSGPHLDEIIARAVKKESRKA